MHPETYDSQYSPVMSSSPKIIPVTNVHHPRPAATASTSSDELRQDSGYFERSYKRSSARSTSSMERLSLQDPPPPTHKAAELWAVPPQQQQQPVAVNETTESKAAPVSLWAVPPQRHPESSSSSSSAAEEEGNNKSIPSVSLWAVPPQSSSSLGSSTNDESKKQQTTSLWAVPPQHSMESSTDPDTNTTSEPVSLWAVPPQKEQETPSSSSSSSLWAVPPQKTLDPVKQQPSSSTSLWAVPPQRSLDPVAEAEDIPKGDDNKHAPVSLWAVPPQHGLEGEGDASATTSSDHSGDGLWAVPPSNAESSNSEADDLTLKPRPRPSASTESTLKKRWQHRRQYSDGGRVPEQETMAGNRRTVRFVSPNATSYVEDGVEKLSLRDDAAASSSNESGSLDDKQHHHRNNHNLHIQIPASDDDTTISSRSPRTPRQRTPLSANSSSGASPISSSHETSEHEDETWGERPSIEQLYRDIDKYLPGHDLDKEIFIDTSNAAAAGAGAGPTGPTGPSGTSTNTIAAAAAAQSAAASPAPRRLQGHKKSIRVVANEAHRNWRQAMNVIRVNHLLRRRSTKMWGRKVEQVKPGMIIEEQSIPKESQDAGYIGMCVYGHDLVVGCY